MAKAPKHKIPQNMEPSHLGLHRNAVLTVVVLVTISLNIGIKYELFGGGEIDLLPKIKLEENNRYNLLSEVSPSGKIKIDGWWIPHSDWSIGVECHDHDFAICSTVYGVQCSGSNIPALYQYVTFTRETAPHRLTLSAQATAASLAPVTADHPTDTVDRFYGVKAALTLSNGTVTTVDIDFPHVTHPYWPRHITFDTATPGVTVLSVLVMLTCFGYMGHVTFTDIQLVTRDDTTQSTVDKHTLLSRCERVGRDHDKRNEYRIVSIHEPVSPKSQYEYSVTWFTQLSLDRLDVFVRNVKLWDGPVSVAIFVDTKDGDSEWPMTYIKKKLPRGVFCEYCAVVVVFSTTPDEPYPINRLRNIAMRRVTTRWMFSLDSDFYPSPNAHKLIAETLRKEADKTRTAFVVPVFEFLDDNDDHDEVVDFESLVAEFGKERPNVVPFRSLESPRSHSATKYQRWMVSSSAYKVDYYDDKYEPYVVLANTETELSNDETEIDDPVLYDERFTGYGMNKVSHITELFAAGYEFRVLPRVWAVHRQHPTSLQFTHWTKNVTTRLRNRLHRFEFLQDLISKYNIPPC